MKFRSVVVIVFEWQFGSLGASCTPSGSIDLRVAKALGAHGYEALRLSAITAGHPLKDAHFSYSAPFRYRWTNFSISTGLTTRLMVGMNEIRIGDSTACVRLPQKGAGVHGVIFGDPCTGRGAMRCRDQSLRIWDVETRLTTLLNSAATGPDPVNFWASIGDNFYDKEPIATKSFYAKLKPEVKSTFMMTVPGNGDFWPGSGTPDLVTCDMPFGYGFLQWYAQDTMAGKQDPKSPFDFSVMPPNYTSKTCKLDTGFCAAPSNFFSYNLLGNIGFIGYSGHTSYDEQEESFKEACEYFQNQATYVKEVVLLGHWSGQDHGCPINGGADTGTLQKTVRHRFGAIPCASAKAFFGHIHCNVKQSFDCGSLGGTSCFQIGAAGAPSTSNMPHGACDAHWGVLHLDTRNGTKLTYYQLGNEDTDLSEPLLQCLQSKSFSDCSEHGMVWLDVRQEENTYVF